MKWNTLFSSIRTMDEDGAKEFMSDRKSGSYQLVDVRQPNEYEAGHLPGARLIPLNLLTNGYGDLDPEKPTILYCQSGGRSQAASQWLSNQGFNEIYDIGTNIRSWLGMRAIGPYEMNLELIRPDAEFPDAFSLAYAMEEGLQRFYLALADQEDKEEHKALFLKLAGFEDLHKERLLKEFTRIQESNISPDIFLRGHEDVMEGGGINAPSPVNVIEALTDMLDVLGLSMGIEAQSLDLYMRLADRSPRDEVKRLFLDLADEEKQHMAFLSEVIDKYLKTPQVQNEKPE